MKRVVYSYEISTEENGDLRISQDDPCHGESDVILLAMSQIEQFKADIDLVISSAKKD